MDELSRRTRRITLITLLAGLTGFGLTIGRGKPLELALIVGAASAGVVLVLVFIMMWRD